MDKLTDKIAALPANSTYMSLEFFPPKTAMGLSNLRDRIDRMHRALRPLFVNVTWGACGSTADKSLELAAICQRELGMTTCLHLTCTNMSRRLVDKALDEAKALGIRNILALRGDAPRTAEYGVPDDSGGEAEFCWAVDLVRYIRCNHKDFFCIGVAAYPEGHADESCPKHRGVEYDLPYLVDKVKAGADFIITQLCFDFAAFQHFERTLREHPSGVLKTIPVIPGIMPIQGYRTIRRITKLSHTTIPEAILERLAVAKEDDEKAKQVGVEIVSELIEQIKAMQGPVHRPQGFHFFTLNLERSVSFIAEQTGIGHDGGPDVEATSEASELPTSLSSVAIASSGGDDDENMSRDAKRSRPHRLSFASDIRNHVIVAVNSPHNSAYESTVQEASLPVEPLNTRASTLAISEGEGLLGQKATWDDYPNGRWGDAGSPAYGNLDAYGTGLPVSAAEALELWGSLASLDDINQMFVRYLKRELDAIPWSEEGLFAESMAIQPQLISLNERGWWTIASQPAVNGLLSSDTVYGWGPRNGYVFQKAFVELFLPSADWDSLRKALLDPGVRDHVSFYACNSAGHFASSDIQHRSAEEPASTNVVTWGIFPGRDVVTPSIIEEVGFRTWSQEAYSIWAKWAKIYRSGSDIRRLLDNAHGDYWLANIIHHDFVLGDALWALLLGHELEPDRPTGG